MPKSLVAKICCLIIAISGITLFTNIGAVGAETLTKDQIIEMLQARATGSTGAPKPRQDLRKRFQIRKNVESGGSASQPAPPKLSEIVREEKLRSIDFELYFEYDSSKLTSEGIRRLIPLGQALSDSKLSTGEFLIAGHTDAAGSDAYNARLSRERARSVKDFLVTSFSITPHRLITVGYGEGDLKTPDQPLSRFNRRVQIVNLLN